MIETDSTSPKAKVIAESQISPITCPHAGQTVGFFFETLTPRELPRRNRKHKRLRREPRTCHRQLAGPHAGQAVDFINSPSCRAGTYFRYAAKVSKGAPKGKGKPFRAVSLFPLETLFPSAESRNASARQACGGSQIRYFSVIRAQFGQLKVEPPTSRGLPLRPRKRKPPRIYARRRSAIGRKMGKIPKKGKKTAPNGCLPFLWHVFAYFRSKAKVCARRTGESQ